MSRSSFRGRAAILGFVIWTAFVWSTRINNTLNGDESTTAKVISIGVALGLLAASGYGLVLVVRSRARSFADVESMFFLWFFRATVAVWAIRAPQILLDASRDVPFKVVHVILGLISVGLGAICAAQAKPKLLGLPEAAVSSAAKADL